MPEETAPFGATERHVRDFFATLLAKLPDKVATLYEHEGSFPRGKVVILSPQRDQSAQMRIDALNGDGAVNLRVGLGTVLDVVFQERTYHGVESLFETFGPVCEAVIAGRLTEAVWYRHDVLVRCVSTITLEGGVRRRWYYSSSEASLFRIGEAKRVVEYAPYVAKP